MKISRSFYNWLTITGCILSINSILLILILFIISMSIESSNAYLGLYIYIVLPMFFVIGLLLIPIGMIIKYRKKEKLADSGLKWPQLDLNNKRHRKSFVVVFILTIIILIVSAMGSYKAFHYSESVEFCGTLCHTIMSPEYTTYQNSPHARVKCVECHVGEGADWYVKSKLSGLYQVYAAVFNKYPRPIQTPIKDLRPARETCEKCHWPQKFYSSKLRFMRRYISDSANTEWDIAMIMKIGPNYSALGLKEGIHWHINQDIKIEYIASTFNRENIPWVRFTNLKTKEVQIFKDSGFTVSQKMIDTSEIRTMDCMDCHNRPSHSFKSASEYLNQALLADLIPSSLPFIRKIALVTLQLRFKSTNEAIAVINDSLTVFYKKNYPELFKSKKGLIDKAITGIQNEYKKNCFPEMKIGDSTYLNHIGHLESDGCFRCHSGRHKNEKGKVISQDCNWCHTIVAQGPSVKMKSVAVKDTLEFIHPVETEWKAAACKDCHRSLQP